MYKKASYNDVSQSGPLDPTTIQLQTVGMRIRKAVAEGYTTPRSNGYLTDFELQQQQIQQQHQHQQFGAPQRIPLPSHLSAPPALSNSNSSTLEGESFDERFLQQQPKTISNKRGREEDSESQDYVDRISVNNKDAPLEYFENKYGSLSFNEEF